MPSLWADTLDEHRALVMRRLLDAFAALTRERGVEHTTLAAVAERAGIARSAVYNYVADKHELLLAHAADVLRASALELERALPRDVPPEERLARYVQATFRSFAAEPSALADVMGLLDPEQQERLLAHLRPMREQLQRLVRDGLADGVFGGAGEEELTRFVWATLAGYRSAWRRGQVDAEAEAATCTRLLLHSLTGGSDGSSDREAQAERVERPRQRP